MNEINEQRRHVMHIDTIRATSLRQNKPEVWSTAEPTIPAPSLRGGPINILIVDDDPRNLTVLETVLDDPDYRMIRAESADQALLALVREEFALLILDIRMPGMTGFELAHMIKARKKTAQVPIIFLTAYYNEDQHVLAGYSTGAVDYLHKPVNAVILRSKVAVFAELFRRTRDCVTTGRALLAEVTARRLAEEQLRELNETLEQRIARSTGALEESHRRKDEFLAMLSHELRNPLAPITSAVQLLRLDEKQDPLQRQASKVIERQVHQLTRLVDDLLEVSRISTGRIHLQPERVDAGEIVTRAVETVRPMLEQRGHALALALSPQPIYLYGDALRLEQVVVNLLTNATKYTDKGGQIWVTTQREGDECVLRVRDTGIGIAPEFLPHIFDLFSQAKRSLDRSQGGLGIGLAVVKGLVTMHHGRVEAESTPGQGCELVVRLPVMVDPAPEPSATHGKSTWPAGTSLRVLIVDDNEDAASMLGSLLEAWGHRVEMTHSGPAALVAALEFRPHVALMDIGLPEMDGYEVARTLRRQAIFDDLVLVATTGYGTDVDRQLSQAAGFDHHLVKPPDLEKLRRLLADVAAPRSVARPAS